MDTSHMKKFKMEKGENGEGVGKTEDVFIPSQGSQGQQVQVAGGLMQKMLLSQLNTVTTNFGIASGRLRSIYDLAMNALEGNNGGMRPQQEIRAILDAIRITSYEYSRYEVKAEDMAADRRPAVIIRMHELFPDGASGQDNGIILLEALSPLLKAKKTVFLDLGGARIYGTEFWNMVMGNLVLGAGKEIVDEYLIMRNVPVELSKLITVIMHNAHMYATDEEFRERVDAEDQDLD